MYSMVLMMAMASGPDTTAFGGHRGGCRGGSCHGVQTTCCAAPAQAACCAPVSYGCHGSSCHGGCHGGGFLGHRNGCHGGGGGLFHRGGHGCCGSSATTYAAPAACCGPVVAPAGSPPATMPAPMGEKKGS
jgi:hypothetical protein